MNLKRECRSTKISFFDSSLHTNLFTACRLLKRYVVLHCRVIS